MPDYRGFKTAVQIQSIGIIRIVHSSGNCDKICHFYKTGQQLIHNKTSQTPSSELGRYLNPFKNAFFDLLVELSDPCCGKFPGIVFLEPDPQIG